MMKTLRFPLLIMCVLAAGCNTVPKPEATGGPAVKAPTLSPEAIARVAQVHRGMRRADVEEILGPQANNIGLSISGMVSDYYSLTPDTRVRVDFALHQQTYPLRNSVDDLVVRNPDTLSVKTETDEQKHERWIEVPMQHVQ